MARERLVDAIARLRASEPRVALVQARAVLAGLDGPGQRGAGAGDEAAVVECLAVIGRCHQALGDRAAARAALERAQDRAVDLDEPLVVVDVLAAVAAQDRIEGRYHDAHDRLGTAIARATRAAGDHSIVVACLRNELGVCCKHLARYDEAEGLYHQAQATLEAHLGPDHPQVAGVWHNRAGLAHARGDHRRAAELGRHGLALRVAALGEGHLDVAADRAALAPILDALDRPDEAETLLRQALVVFEQVLAARREHDQLTAQRPRPC